MIRRAKEGDLVLLREFHISNHLQETCHFPGERENQISELEIDFPQLYSLDVFKQGTFWVATEENDEKIVGCIGIIPDKCQPKEVTWLNTFSVAREVRGKKIGSKLLIRALTSIKTSITRLVTLGGHSEHKDVMGAARYLYEKNGFAIYQKETVKYGHSTTIEVLHYEKKMF